MAHRVDHNACMGTPATAPARSKLRLLSAYAPLVILPTVVLAAWNAAGTAGPRWVLMWLMAVALFAGCKWLTWYSAHRQNVPASRQFAFLFLWPGLDADAFMAVPTNKPAQKPASGEWLMALFNMTLGAGMFWGLARCWPAGWELAQGWTAMAGFILLAHCGAFQLLSCAWRAIGVDAKPLMNWPLRSESVSEFWGRRWNIAFRDLAHRFLFAPLARALGPRVALVAGFLFSGAVHELAVTVPAGGGYGGPTFFFTLQGIAILFERSPTGRALGLGRGVRGWVFTMLALLVPVGLAFPPVFVHNVILPMMHAAGAR